MSIEIKNLEVENEEAEDIVIIMQRFGWKLKNMQRIYNRNIRPTGGITYEGVTFIHSETETTDFTQLVFERDTQIPNYRRLVLLEKEFFELVDSCPEERPREPEKILDIEEWCEKNKPWVLSTSVTLGMFLVSWLLVHLIFRFIVFAPEMNEFEVSMELLCLFDSFFISLPIFLSFSIITNITKRKSMLISHTVDKNKNVMDKYDHYKKGYDAQIEKIAFYDRIEKRIKEICTEAELLLDIYFKD